MSEESAATRSVVMEKEFPYAPAKVWRALTEGPLLQEWLMQNDFLPVVGHRFHFRATPAGGWDGVVQSEVLLVEPPVSLSYRWDSMGVRTVVLWTLTATAAGTWVRMEQSGFRADHEMAYKGAGYGWQRFFGGLERVVAELA